MISRRKFTASASAAALLRWAPSLAMTPSPAGDVAQRVNKQNRVSRFVRPEIGTGGHGHCYPGATVPFGMVQLSPDTFNKGWDWCSGYNYADDSIMGFSHTHLSGKGLVTCWMSCNGMYWPGKDSAGSRESVGERVPFSFLAQRGKLSSRLLLSDASRLWHQSGVDRDGRTGVHRYTFPESTSSYIIIDLDHAYDGSPGTVKGQT